MIDYETRLENAFRDSGFEHHDGSNGDIFELNEWLTSCKNRYFIDYDGYGYFAWKRNDGSIIKGKINIYPSDITKLNLIPPSWATHVIWYNRYLV